MKLKISTVVRNKARACVCAAIVAIMLCGLLPVTKVSGVGGAPSATTIAYNHHSVPPVDLPLDNSKHLRCVVLQTTCPLLTWGNYQFWVYGEKNSEYFLTIVSFQHGNLLAYRTYGKVRNDDPGEGTRYHTSTTVDANAETISLVGSNGSSITVPWSDLLEMVHPEAPVLTANPTTPTNGNVTVTITYPDNATVREYRIDDGAWGVYAGEITMTSNGTIDARAENAAGLLSEVSEYVVSNIDLTAPEAATFVANPTTPTTGNVTVTITYPDDAHVREYRVDDGNWQAYTNPVVVTDNGAVYARSSDEAGNESEESSYQVTNIDRDPPEAATFAANPATPTTGNVTLTITYPNDAHVREYRVDDGNWQAYTDPVVVTDNVTVYARSSDELGNVSEESSYEVANIDRDPPEAATFAANPATPTTGNVTVTITYPDDAHVREYRVDDGNWQAYTNPVVVTDNGAVYARSSDEAGNVSEESSHEVTNIDREAPVLTVDAVSPLNVRLNSDFSNPSATAADNLDGDITDRITIDGEVNTSMPGEYVLTYSVSDTAGNQAEETITVTVARIAAVVPPNNSSNNGLDLLINGKAARLGTITTSEANERTIVSVTINEDLLERQLQAERGNVTIEIPVLVGGNTITGVLTGRAVKHLENKQAIVELQTSSAAYALPAAQINIDAIAGQLGEAVKLEDITIHIDISEPSQHTVQLAEDAANSGQFVLVAPPVEFAVYAAYGEQVVRVTSFHRYVERSIAIPDDVDPDAITTGVVIDPDGTVRHMPTRIAVKDGKPHAVISSLSNSAYSVIWNPVQFGDMERHWAKEAVNDMGSRMIIAGFANGDFRPDEEITRAEFAAIIVRGLGLAREGGAAPFTDVEASDWYGSAVNTAYAYGLIDGLTDGTFRPNERITREQAMTVIARAMSLTGLQSEGQSQDDALLRYIDAADVSQWARRGVASSVQTGIVRGRGNAELAPKAYVSRAEVAVMLRQLLIKSELI